MGYRQLELHHHHENRTAQKTSTPATFFMENGTTFSLAVPCWYKEIHLPERTWHHCRAAHDYKGWPEPNRTDNSCQDFDFRSPHYNGWGCNNPYLNPHKYHDHYIDMARLYPIHLTEEGYTDPVVVFDTTYSGLVANAWIDDTDDWVIRIYISAYLSEAVEESVSTKFIVKLSRTDEDKKKIVDVAARGTLKILPAPVEA